MDRRNFIAGLSAGVLLSSVPAFATVYFTKEAVKLSLFPDATRFVDRTVSLTNAQMKQIKKAARTRVTDRKVVALEAYRDTEKLGTLFIDRVYGKHEFITFALALDPTDSVMNLEIMDYKETYGDQIRWPKWRAQFTGKRFGDPLKIDKQIKNISGATLSCVHIIEGVRRLLATKALVLPSA